MLYDSRYNNIIAEYNKKRSLAIEKANQKLDEFMNEYPEYKLIEQEIRDYSIKSAKMLASNNNLNSKECEEHIEELLSRKKKFLESLDLDESYFEPEFECKLCNDTGFVNGKKCVCLQNKLIHSFYKLSHLGDILDRENFNTFKLKYYSDRPIEGSKDSPNALAAKAFSTCWNFVKNFDKSYNNLLIHGQAGLGKTFLSHCIAKELLDQAKIVIYITAGNMFDMLAAYRFRNENNDINEQINDCDLLIIDDLGTEITTSVVISELFSIINGRIINQKPVIISSNLSPNQIGDRYGERIFSRIMQNYDIIELIGKDIRKQLSMEEHNG